MREEPAIVREKKGPQEYAEGHRERLGARYQQGGEAVLQDHELLELFLTFATPRRDIKVLPKILPERFGRLPRAPKTKVMW